MIFTSRVISKVWFLTALFVFATTLFQLPSHCVGQSDVVSKKSLNHSDYDKWHTVSSQRLSNDGKWISYSIRSGKVGAESTLKIRQFGAAKEYAISRASGPQFSFDSKYIIYRVRPDSERIKKLKKAKAKPDEMPGTYLEVLELETGKKFNDERVRSFQQPAENSTWLAYLLDKPLETGSVKQQNADVVETYEVTSQGLKRPEKKPKLKKRPVEEKPESEKPELKKKEAEKKTEAKSEEGKSEKSDEKKKEHKKEKSAGTTLVLRNLSTGRQQTYPDVVRYEFSKNGSRLGFVTSVEKSKTKPAKTKSAKDKDSEDSHVKSDGVYVVDLSDLKLTKVLAGEGEYKNLDFNEDGSQLAFISNTQDYASKTSSWSLYHWKVRSKEAKLIADEQSEAFPKGWWISPNTSPLFSEDGKRLYFETAPVPEKVAKERKNGGKETEEKEEEPKAKLDLWHWQDPYLQPQQLLQAEIERRRSYRAVYNLKTKKLVQLATKDIPSIQIDTRSQSNVAVATSNMPYRKMLSWDIPGFQDTHLINLDTGEQETLLEKSKSSGRLSPEGKFITWFDGEQQKWFAMSTGKQRKQVEISKGIEFPLQNELHDTPNLARPYGSAGWLKDDEAILVYDRFDIWKLDPTGKSKPVCITMDTGRKNSIRFRFRQLDRRARSIDPVEPMLLTAFNEKTKASGFYRLKPPTESKSKTEKNKKVTGSSLRRLIMLDERLSGLTKARDSNHVVFSRSTFQRYPDLWSSTTDMKKIHRVSEANPQQEDYRWGSAELVHWKATDGQPLDGILYKPDGFDPDKKYPLMVYFYERNSDNLHSYYTPAAGRSIINHSFYVSRGYLVFVPDIPYKTGEPGPSAANAVLPGVQSLIDLGFVKKDKIGMQGHSWGGYQTAYLVTQTDMFACAESGAPVSNMTSAYGGIRWGSGMSRMFQYERTQSRIGADLWSARQKYIANSPVFFADKVNTPLLILHNDEDGAVPWYQGIEMFVALRRLEKPAWLMNYNGEPHWVMKDANRMDFAIRMQQFFDHYLMDAPEPEWMAYGVPAVDKGKKFGLDLLEPEKEEAESSKEKEDD
jgi:dipeptidyl aminopeptidase/acylaminoacyl peptidase